MNSIKSFFISLIIFIVSILLSNPLLATEAIGVMPFETKQAGLGQKIGAQILVSLAKTRRFTLVERAQLKKALDEIAKNQDGSINSAGVLKIGKMSGAKYLVIGDIQVEPDQINRIKKTYTANVRIIKTETGVIVGADSAQGTFDYISKALSIRVKQLLSIYLVMENPKSPYTILLKLGKGKNPVYKTGETLSLKFKVKKHLQSASDKVYMQIFSIDSRGSMTMIYPNKFANGMQIEVGKDYSFPSKSDDFEWELVPPAGTESIQAIVTQKPVYFFKESENFKSNLFPEIKNRESVKVWRAIRIKIKKEKLKDWSAERITYKLLKDR